MGLVLRSPRSPKCNVNHQSLYAFDCCSFIIVNVLCVAGLGISQNYYLSLAIRLIHGLADGLLGVTKTILTEMSNEKNVSLGTSFLFIGAAIGRIVGPLLSGYFTNAEFISHMATKIPILKKVGNVKQSTLIFFMNVG